MRVPSAEPCTDGLLHLGRHTDRTPVSDAMGGTTTYSLALGFLPRTEIALGLGSRRSAYDLTAHVRGLVRTGRPDRVGVAIGACDLKRTLGSSPTGFVVATYPDDGGPMSATVGVAIGGTSGPLAGLRWRPHEAVTLKADHAEGHTNLGLDTRFAERWEVGVAHLDNGTVATIGYSAPCAPGSHPPPSQPVTASHAVPSSVDAVVEALIQCGFEDVAVALDTSGGPHRLVVAFEDRVHTVSPADGIVAAVGAVAANAPRQVTTLNLRTLHRGAALVEIETPIEVWRSTASAVDRARIAFLPGHGGRPHVLSATRPANRSAGRADLILGPGVRTNIGTDYGTAQVGLSARPEALLRLGGGLMAVGRWSYPITGELVRGDPKRLQLDRAALGYLFAPRRGWLAQAWIGRWPMSRRGMLVEAAAAVGANSVAYAVGGLIDDRALGARGYLTLEYRHLIPGLRLGVGLVAGRYAWGDVGAGIEVSRFFGDVMVGLGLRSTDLARLAQVRVMLPLSPRPLTRPTGSVRFRLPDYYHHRQRSLIHGPNHLTTADAAASEVAIGASLMDTALGQGRLTE
ncbi:MAG: YjbH domain-containing protein, partial [Armatimonadetes bacterium]|nr:YjbH domain-containing protein [Armatimonadota bacterium]